jgi:hypothetical protein
MATLQEVRRAIYWGERFIHKHYYEFDWNGHRFGVLRALPGTPLSLKLYSKPQVPLPGIDITNRDWLTAGNAGNFGFVECVYGGIWCPDVRIETIHDDGETWEGYYIFQYWYIQNSDILHLDLCRIHVKYYPSPYYLNRMRIEITPETGVDGDLYLNVEYSPDIKRYGEPTKLVFADGTSNIRNHVGETIIKETGDFGCFPSNEYCVRYDTQIYALYCWDYSPSYRDRASKCKAFMDYYGWNPKYYMWASSHRLNDDLPDNPWGSPEFAWHECEVQGQLPRGLGLYPHWSRSCFCRLMTTKWFDAVFLDPVHWLNKYKNPNQSIYIGTGKNPETLEYEPVYTTPRAYCLGPQVTIGAWDGVINEPYYPPQSFIPGKGFYGPLFWALPGGGYYGATEGIIVLGYGFNVEEAKVLADQMVDVWLKSQWGYPFNSGEECYGYTSNYGEPKRIRRPDFTGAFMPTWEVVTVGDGEVFSQKNPTHVPWSLLRAILGLVSGLLHIEEPPPDTAIYLPSWVEDSIYRLHALRIYEYYKYRLKV